MGCKKMQCDKEQRSKVFVPGQGGLNDIRLQLGYLQIPKMACFRARI